MKIKYTTILTTIVFLVFLGFAGLENYFSLMAFVVILFIGISMDDLNLSVISLFLILAIHTAVYIFNYSSISLDWTAKNLLNPVILFMVGYWLTRFSKSDKAPARSLIWGFFFHGSLNLFLYILNPSSMTERSLINIWGGQLTATLQNLLFIPIVSLLFYGLYIVKDKKEKIIIIVANLIAVYGTVISASRTLLYLIIICFLLGIVLNAQKNNFKRIDVLFSVLILICVFVGIYEFDIAGIRTWVESSNLGERILGGIQSNDSLLENVRWEMSLKILAALPSQPFGKITVVHYAHNLFLDLAKYTGVIPALGLLIWSIIALQKYYRYVRFLTSNKWDVALLSMAIGFMIAFFLEPVLDGLPIVFSAFCYLCGIMKGRRDWTVGDNREYEKGEMADGE